MTATKREARPHHAEDRIASIVLGPDFRERSPSPLPSPPGEGETNTAVEESPTGIRCHLQRRG
jgi:hypothetical protein